MTYGLKTAIATTCANHLKSLLLIQQELVVDRKEKGIKIYSLKEYNKKIQITFYNNIKYRNNTLNLLDKIENELSNNVLLTNEEIDELTTRFKEGIIKFGLKQECYNINFTFLVRDILKQDIYEKQNEAFEKGEYLIITDKWKNILKTKQILGLPSKIMLYYSYENYFSLSNINRDYVCLLDEFGKDITNTINLSRRSENKVYLAKNTFLVLLKNNKKDIIFKDKDKYKSILFNDKEYIEDDILYIEELNNYLKMSNLEIEEMYNKKEIIDILNIIEKYVNIEIDLNRLVLSATNYICQIIFDTSISSTYQNYINLLPTYTKEQAWFLKEELFKLIKTNLLKKEKLELNFIPSYNNPLIKLLNNLFILPSPNVIGKIIIIDLNKDEIKIIDQLTNEEKIIYGKSKKKNSKSLKRMFLE